MFFFYFGFIQKQQLVARSVLDCLDMPPRRQSTLALAPVHADPELADDDQPRLPGHGRVWGKYVCRNKDQSSSSRYPYVCALSGCAFKYTESAANATKIGRHVCRVGGMVKACSGSTAQHMKDFPQFSSSPKSNRRVPGAAVDTDSAQGKQSQSAAHTASTQQTTLDPNGMPSCPYALSMSEIVALQEAEEERQRALLANMSTLPSMLPHVVNKVQTARLNKLWARAFFHAGIPPNAIEDDSVRDAIFQTSKCQVTAESA
jgi:hypothetical protein